MLWLSNQTWVLIGTGFVLLWLYIRRRMSFLQNLGFVDSDSGFMGIKTIRRFTKDMNHTIYKLDFEKRKKYGEVYGTYSFLSPVVTIWDTEIMKEIFIKKYHLFADRQKTFLKLQGKELNNGLTAISGAQWKRVRSTLSPTFSTSKLKEMLPIVKKCGEKFIERINTIVAEKEGVFELKSVLGRYTMNVICSSAFSGNMDLQTGDEEPEVSRQMREALGKSIFKDPSVIILLFFPWLEKVYEKMDYTFFGKDFLRYMRSFFAQLLKIDPHAAAKKHDMFHTMLKSEISEEETKTATKGMTRLEIVGNSQLMVLAGYDTVSTALLFLLYNLATHPHIQDRLREEVYAAMERNNGELNYQAIHDNEFLMMCINESFRLYPNAPINQRVCEDDVTIKGHRFAKNLMVQIPVYGLHHDDNYWNEPFSYIPERFEDMSKIDPFMFQPFGMGPRNCIGMRFALMVIKYTVSALLTNFEIGPADSTPQPPLEMAFTSNAGPKEVIELKMKRLST